MALKCRPDPDPYDQKRCRRKYRVLGAVPFALFYGTMLLWMLLQGNARRQAVDFLYENLFPSVRWEYVEMNRIVIGIVVAIFPVNIAWSQDTLFRNLEGHSIISNYQEEITSRKGDVFQIDWRDTLYISTKGRIFHRFSQTNTKRGFDKNLDNVSDEGGRSEGKGAGFRWAGDGLVRQWTNRTGVKIRQSIHILLVGDGFACKASIERNGGKGRVRVVRDDCRVVAGNSLAN